MHILVYIIVFLYLIYYVNKNKKQNNKIKKNKNNKVNEEFKDNNIKEIREYSDNPILTYTNDTMAPADLSQDNIYNNKFWVIKSTGLSDIFNNEDLIIKSETKPKVKSEIKPKSEIKSEIKRIPKKIIEDKKKYILLGNATNEYYNQNYLIYEYEVNYKPEEKRLTKLYEYLLVSIIDNKPKIQFKYAPRTKININDTTYLAQGPLQQGPFFIKKY